VEAQGRNMDTRRAIYDDLKKNGGLLENHPRPLQLINLTKYPLFEQN